jgi:alkaline phosphatase
MSMKRLTRSRYAGLIVLTVVISASFISAKAGEKARNVVVLIADGCSAEQYTFARWFKGSSLSFDPFRVGAVKTYIADSVIADSAPAASAFATGVRTSDKFIGVGPRPEMISAVPAPEPALQYKPMATVLEGARLMGKATGIVATSRVSHATPGAFIAHVHSREREDDIMEQAVHQRIDVVLGGGKGLLLPKGTNGNRKDAEDLTLELKGMGYKIVEDRTEMMEIEEGPVFGMFAFGHMDAEIDRPRLHPDQPTLEEMTRKAIELLCRDPDGFFLMVEGSQIDWACHANDPAHLLSDLLAFDKAAEAALDFARKDGATLVLVLSDHNAGGFSIGNYEKGRGYTQVSEETLVAPFRRMKSSASLVWKVLGGEKSARKTKEAVREGWGMEITDADAEQILLLAGEYKRRGLAEHFALGRILCPRYTHVGWSTHGHTGGDVPLHAYGPGRPAGLLDGPDIGRICAKAMGLNLARLNDRLFVDAGSVFGDARVKVDKADPLNPVVRIRHGDKDAELPINKHWLILDGKARRMEGVVVYAEKTERVHIPMQAVNMIRGSMETLPRVSESHAKAQSR